MRIIGGVYKGRRLNSPIGQGVRPTSSRVREAIFNILTHGLTGKKELIKDAIVLDLFCGTGAFGLEALSRGAAHITFLDCSQPTLAVARRNAAFGFEIANSINFLRLDATKLPPAPRVSRSPCHIAFLDPPYGKNLAVPALISLKTQNWLIPGAIAILETRVGENFLEPCGYKILDTRSYGLTQVTFMQLSE